MDQKPKEQQTQTQREVPAAALCFNVGRFEFAQDVDAQDKDGKTVPVKLLGRTGKPIAHWYWGNVVHDLSGMKLHKESLPIDYCHNADEVIGYLDKFDTSTGDLIATGALVPFAEQDRAREVIFKSQNKVPYEASINFAGGPMRLEELEAGTSATVNGNLVQGPALIIREWTLRGIAVCPYGADMNTHAEMSAQDQTTVQVTLFRESQMSQANSNASTDKISQTPPTPAAPAAAGAELQQKQQEPPQPNQAAAPQTPAPKPGQEFIDAFGDTGARWHFEGRAFADCSKEFIAQKDKRIVELEDQVKTLQAQIAAMPRGNEPATFQAEKRNVNPRAAQLQENLGDNLGRFAAGIKLPDAKK